MAKIFLIGKVDRFSVVFDWERDRGIVKANTAKVRGAPVGVALESLVPGPNAFFPAMVMIHAKWRKHYFLLEREGWTPEDYFKHADRLMMKHGIIDP